MNQYDIQDWADDISNELLEISQCLLTYIKDGAEQTAETMAIIDNLYYDTKNDLCDESLKSEARRRFNDKVTSIVDNSVDHRIFLFDYIIDRVFLSYIIYKYAKSDEAHRNKNVFNEVEVNKYDE